MISCNVTPRIQHLYHWLYFGKYFTIIIISQFPILHLNKYNEVIIQVNITEKCKLGEYRNNTSKLRKVHACYQKHYILKDEPLAYQ